MNSNSPIIVTDVLTFSFTPAIMAGITTEWIGQSLISNFGNAGEILEVSSYCNGGPGVRHGIRQFSFWIANYDFSPLITGPRTAYASNRGPTREQVVFASGENSAFSDVNLDPYMPLYDRIFIAPIPYVSGANFRFGFTAKGEVLVSNLKVIIKARRTQ
jgi:hypothetical protein